MYDVMIDIETLSTGTRAHILSIGAVQFDLETGAMGDTFHEYIRPSSAAHAGCRTDPDTVLWWMQQSDAARQALVTGLENGHDIGLVFQMLHNFTQPEDRVWGNGSNFDNRILRETYDLLGWKCPWSFRHDRDVRTFMDMAERMGIKIGALRPYNSLRHDALADARVQAQWMINVWGAMRGGIAKRTS